MLRTIPLLIGLGIASLLPAQHSASHHENQPPNHEEPSSTHFRAAVLLGHTLITPGELETRLFVPSWGLDLEYWPSHRFGIGLHTDVELQDFVVLNQDREEVERSEPFIITLDGLYRSWGNLILLGGAGLELEGEHTFWLLRGGLEYEIPFGKNFDLFPSLFYDQRFDGYNTLTFGLGVGIHL